VKSSGFDILIFRAEHSLFKKIEIKSFILQIRNSEVKEKYCLFLKFAKKKMIIPSKLRKLHKTNEKKQFI